MKKIFFSLTVIILLAMAAACSPTPAASIPTSTPIPATPTPDDNFYVKEAHGFRLQIPETYRIEELPPRAGVLFALGLAPSDDDQTQEFGFPFGLSVYEKPREMALLDWFSLHIGGLTESGQPTPAEALFFDPMVLEFTNFKGSPALVYSGGLRPVPHETVIDRGDRAVGLYYLGDYPYASEPEPVYDQMLQSLEFFEPSEAPAAVGTQPAPTPPACLEASAEPRALPPRESPLEVQFISDGNIWFWEEGGTSQQISDTGDARSFSFSPDTNRVAFARGPLYEQTELWTIDADGANLRLLVSADQLHALAGEPSTTETPYLDNIVNLTWIAGEQRLGFEINREYMGIGGCCDPGGAWQVNLDTGEISAWSAPEAPEPQEGLLSPDGELRAIQDDESLSIAHPDGTILYPDVLSFQSFPMHEGGSRSGPTLEWAHDSQSLLAITISEDIVSDQSTFTTWRIPVNGNTAEELATFSGLPHTVSISPDQKYLAYLKRVQPTQDDHELHLATFDGSKDILYAAQYGLRVLHWHPDSHHFVYYQDGIFQPLLGSVCGNPMPLLSPLDLPVPRMEWVDATRFIFVRELDPYRHQRELRLGQIGGESVLIGPCNAEYCSYVFNVESAPLAQE